MSGRMQQRWDEDGDRVSVKANRTTEQRTLNTFYIGETGQEGALSVSISLKWR